MTAPYAEIVVVTRAPRTSGNMAMGGMSLYIETEQASQGNGWIPEVESFMEWLKGNIGADEFVGIMLSLREPVFEVGEILFLDSNGREVIGAGRKPDKWDIGVQHVDSLEDAIKLSNELGVF
jgi:hypothetical protein